MRIIFSIIFIALGVTTASSQISNVKVEFPLPTELSESSGAIFFNNKLITHNDSGNSNTLYELDITTKLVTRTVTITNATNVDWEDITQDDNYIYIGDIGNNVSGNRTDLKIYKINKNDYLSSTSVTAETIAISYANQTDFTASSANTTEWDAEALVSFNASYLILFSKNWVNGNTKGYLISKTPGVYALTPLTTTLNSGGLITGGTFNPLSGKLYLIGYTNILQPFVWKSEGFNTNDIFSGTNTQTMLASLGFEQAEAITFKNENSYFVTSESFSQSFISNNAKLISFSTNDPALSVFETETKNNILIYPNPVVDTLNIDSNNVESVEIFDTKLSKLYYGNTTKIGMQNFAKGVYFVKIKLTDTSFLIKKLVKK